jgi:hypothetical protein
MRHWFHAVKQTIHEHSDSLKLIPWYLTVSYFFQKLHFLLISNDSSRYTTIWRVENHSKHQWQHYLLTNVGTLQSTVGLVLSLDLLWKILRYQSWHNFHNFYHCKKFNKRNNYNLTTILFQFSLNHIFSLILKVWRFKIWFNPPFL